MIIIDSLVQKIIQTKNPTVVGLDPDIACIPNCYKQACINASKESVADMIVRFNRDIIDTIAPIVPAVKPQMAFYEMYGSCGVRAFEQTVSYAKSKGLLVIEDAKRNDIGNTARAYANGHLGKVALHDDTTCLGFDVDFLTVTPFLGSESLAPFMQLCLQGQKGVFVLVKTSNLTAGQIQDAITKDGNTVSEMLASQLHGYALASVGQYGYSSIGAVVGATYPTDAQNLRAMMPHNYFLVPGYGAQGGSAEDVLPCFDESGLGALVNSSRGILYTHMSPNARATVTRTQYLSNVQDAVLQMQNDLYQTLHRTKTNMQY